MEVIACMLSAELRSQWVTELNLPLEPEFVTPGSHRMVWWRCSKGHLWKASVKSRSCGCSCPVCANRAVLPGQNDLASTHPEIAAQWDIEHNGELTPQDVVAGSHKRVWWRCEHGHEWLAAIYSRTTSGTGCPVCTGKRVLPGVNDLLSQFPELSLEWDYELNGELTPQKVSTASNRRVWWRCSLGHEWQAIVASRTRMGTGCPYCAGRKVLEGFNDLASRFPKLAEQWATELNGGLKPNEVTTGCSRRVWWRCSEGHIWRAPSIRAPAPKNAAVPSAPGL